MKRFGGMLLCLAIALVLFFIMRPLLDPADMPKVGQNVRTLISKLQEQVGMDSSSDPTPKQGSPVAPAFQGGIPSALCRFVEDGGLSSSVKNAEWLLTRRFAKEDYSSVFSQVAGASSVKSSVNVYPFSPVPRSYVVTDNEGSFSLVLVMRQESGKWKIDNVILPTVYDSFLDINEINWDCTPYFDYD